MAYVPIGFFDVGFSTREGSRPPPLQVPSLVWENVGLFSALALMGFLVHLVTS
jgi:hypothetical protein